MNASEIITPHRLRPGQTIGICAPGTPVAPQHEPALLAGIRVLEWFSVYTKTAPRTVADSATTPQARVDTFHALWRDPDVRMIMLAQCEGIDDEFLSGLDYELFRRDPKLLLGPAGATGMLNAIHAKSGIVTYIGSDLVWGFGRRLAPPIRDNFIDTFFAGLNVPLQPRKRWDHLEDETIDNPGWSTLSQGRATGRLIGGNLTAFAKLVERGQAPSSQGALLLLEDTLSETKDVRHFEDRVAEIEALGALGSVGAVVFGWFDGPKQFREAVCASLRSFVAEKLAPRHIPVLHITDFGHNVENFVFPIGRGATVDTDAPSITVVGHPTDEPADM